jgi:cyclophilin family peptidyl-prolyl cis-trans isomerase
MKKFLLFAAVGTLLVGCKPATITPNANTSTNSQIQADGLTVTDAYNANATAQINIDSATAINSSMQPTPTMTDTTAATKAIIKTSMGDITVAFYADESPKTVANFVKLAEGGFYDGTRFHRIIPDFMIQAGDPLSKDDSKQAMWGTGGPGYKFADEFNKHLLVKGSLAMANAGPNTNGSQFFIVTKDSTPWLDGKHTNFGYVVDGMDVVDKIGAVQTGAQDRPLVPVTITSIAIVK